MSKSAAVISLAERAEIIRDDRGDNVPVDDIASVVGSLMEGTTYDDDMDGVATELRELMQYIGAAKSELVAIQPKSVSNRDIPDATNQLGAIVQATEDAAGVILDAAEIVSEVAENIDEEQGTKLVNLATHLFEASSFQDLTGQRITKVEKILSHLEERLDSLADAIGDTYVAPPEDEEIAKDDEGVAINDDDLLHGPQLEGEGNTQAEIDALLASFD